MSLDVLPFAYDVIYSKRRSVQLTVAAGRLTVRAPRGTSEHYLHALLSQKQQWVLKHLALSPLSDKTTWLERQHILIAGKWLAFHWQLAAKGAVEVNSESMLVTIAKRVTPARREAYIQAQVQQYCITAAEQFFNEQVGIYASMMKVSPKVIRIGSWRRKWGSCDSRGVLAFNWRLAQAPSWVARYVVIHELAHLRYMDHSVLFWQLVQQFYPDYQQAQLWLKQHQHELL